MLDIDVSPFFNLFQIQAIRYAIACAFSSEEIYMRSHIPSNFQPRTLGIVLIFSP
jgi:hypothetical protein